MSFHPEMEIKNCDGCDKVNCVVNLSCTCQWCLHRIVLCEECASHVQSVQYKWFMHCFKCNTDFTLDFTRYILVQFSITHEH